MHRIERASLEYQEFYCEENAWLLLARPELAGLASWAVIVSNGRRSVALFRQWAGRPPGGLVRWDYHVFAAAVMPASGLIALDPDSDLPFPCPFARYLAETFPLGDRGPAAPRFRLIEGPDYVSGLVSDRSHMLGPDGSYLAPPPPWPAPGSGSGRPSLLMEWIDMERPRPGALCDSARMAAFAAERGAAP